MKGIKVVLQPRNFQKLISQPQNRRDVSFFDPGALLKKFAYPVPVVQSFFAILGPRKPLEDSHHHIPHMRIGYELESKTINRHQLQLKNCR